MKTIALVDRPFRLQSNRGHMRTSFQAFTLVEVVAGLVLMATVLATAMTAFNRHQEQVVASEDLLVASEVADAILWQLSFRQGGIPDSSSGMVAANPQWRWQTQFVGLAEPLGVAAKVIRFRIVNSDGREIIAVEVFRPLEGAG